MFFIKSLSQRIGHAGSEIARKSAEAAKEKELNRYKKRCEELEKILAKHDNKDYDMRSIKSVSSSSTVAFKH